MKKYLLVIMLLPIGYLGTGQSFLQQKLEQIVKLQVYITQLEKGYNIVEKGLTTIGDIKNGHFSLDRDFFAGLQAINPRIKSDEKVTAILTLNKEIVNQYQTTMKAARKSVYFSEKELDYMDGVFSNLLEGCTALTDALANLLTPSRLQMSDDERIHRIGGLYDDMKDRSAFAQAFSNEAKVLALQRSRESREAAMLRALYGQ